MTKKDYELIARVIRGLCVDEIMKGWVALAFAAELQRDNPRFKAATFYAACGQPTEQSKGRTA